MKKSKYSAELKQQAIADYEACKDAKMVGEKYGVTPKQIWTWKSLKDSRPEKDLQQTILKLKKELIQAQEEVLCLKEIVKKTAKMI